MPLSDTFLLLVFVNLQLPSYETFLFWFLLIQGATADRLAPDDKPSSTSTIGKGSGDQRQRILKDLNWLSRERRLSLGPEKATKLLAQLRMDCRLLSKLGIMDYSLLIGIHQLTEGEPITINYQYITRIDSYVSFIFKSFPITGNQMLFTGKMAGSGLPGTTIAMPKRFITWAS